MEQSRKIVFLETGVVALGVLICGAIMVGVFALIGHFSLPVVWGALVGCFLTVANFFFMAVGTSLAADKAEAQNVAGGKGVIRTSMIIRYVALALLLFAFGKSGICNPIALVLPLAFVRPVLLVSEFFRKPGDKKHG